MPGKIRVSALAKELGISSKETLAALAELGETVSSASSSVTPEVADRVRAAVPVIPTLDVAETAAETAAGSPGVPAAEEVPAAAPAKKAARKRAPRKATAPVTDPAAQQPVAAVEAPLDSAAERAAETAAGSPADAEQAPAPAKKTARKRAAKKAAPAADAEAPAGTDGEAPATAAPGVLFLAPDEAAPRRSRRRGGRAAAATDEAAVPETTDKAEALASDGRAAGPDGAISPRTAESAETAETTEADADEVREVAAEQASGARRRRRRGRRGRGGGNSGGGDETGNEDADAESHDSGADGAENTADTADTAEDAETGEDSGEAAEGEQSSSSRRRRRRRRSGSGGDSESREDGDETDDPPNTVTHVREPKKKSKGGGDSDDDGVRGVKGSTRLEAKRQRRRDGRDTSRRRAPILTEAEFLARREAVDRVMAVRQNGDRTQIAVLEDDVLVEHYVTRASATSYVGNVYLGRVQNVLPSMEAAFIDIGKGRNGVLYAGEVNWDAAGLEGKSRAIEQALKSGDSVLVQVTKDPIGHKGARLTSQISLPGRFLVYVPGGGMTGISRRLPDTERHRLKAILKKIVPEDAGVIVRTAAEGASEEDLTRDVERLQQQWESISAKAETKKSAPVLLHGEPDLAIRVVRDVFNEDFTSLVVEGDDAWTTVSEYVEGVAPDLAERVSRHTKDTDLFHDLRVDEQLMKALDRKVWLPSGGSLVIDRTEAMTVVDVNTGKFVGSGGNLEQTVTRNNLEAAEEIVRQLRLRDVGGIVVIDFIDMVLESNRELVLRRLTECLGRDRTKHQVAEVTSLGLVQMTRKRVGEGLLEAFSEPCEHCKGRGVIVHGEPVDQHASGGSGQHGSAQQGSAGGAGDDDRPRGKRRRGRGGNGAAAEPVEALPETNDEQRRAASAAIAAIHRAAAGEQEADEPTDGDASQGEGKVAELATDLVQAVMAVEEAEATSTPAVTSHSEPAHGETSHPEPEIDAVEPPAAQSNGASSGGGTGRRRRRAASRPAGPPVPTSTS